MEEQITNRGFIHLEPVPTTYGHIVRIYESSAAMAPHIWLDVDLTEESARAAHSNIEPENATAHMSLEQAELIHAQLGYMIQRTKERWGIEDA